VSSEISDFTPCAHAQSNSLYIKYVEKTVVQGLALEKVCRVRVRKRKIMEVYI